MSRLFKTAALGATLALAVGAAPVSAAGHELAGDLTLWHTYSSGAGTELDALTTVLVSGKTANPGLNITVLEVPFGDVFNKFQLEVASVAAPTWSSCPTTAWVS